MLEHAEEIVGSGGERLGTCDNLVKYDSWYIMLFFWPIMQFLYAQGYSPLCFHKVPMHCSEKGAHYADLKLIELTRETFS